MVNSFNYCAKYIDRNFVVIEKNNDIIYEKKNFGGNINEYTKSNNSRYF